MKIYGQAYGNLDRLNYSMWMKLEEAVRTGNPVFKDLKLTEDEQRIYSEGVESFTVEAANALPFAHDFTSHHRVMDLGGGTGSFLTAVLMHASHLEVVLFERPQVAAVARQRIPQAIADRIRVVEGDFFTDPIPQDSDVIIISNVMHLLLPEHNLVLLRRLRQHIPCHLLYSNPRSRKNEFECPPSFSNVLITVKFSVHAFDLLVINVSTFC